MLYEFACSDDLLEVAGACGVKDVWVTPCFKLTPDQDHPLRQHYQVTIVVTTRLPQGIALYQREIGGDCRVKAGCVDLARELSNRRHLLAYIANAIGRLNPNFVFHSGLWTVPADVKLVRVPPRMPEVRKNEAHSGLTVYHPEGKAESHKESTQPPGLEPAGIGKEEV